jgi:hypothetical protein
MNFKDFRDDHLLKDLGRSNTTIIALAPKWTNTAIKDIYRSTNLWLSYKTIERDITQGKRSYSIPELLDDEAFFYFLSSDETEWKDIRTEGQREAILTFTPEDTGEPELIVIGKKSYNVFPLPDQTYKLRARIHSFEEDLTNTDPETQESDLINEDLNVVLTKALYYGFRYLEEFDKADYYLGHHKDALKELIKKNTRKLLGSNFTLTPSQNTRGRASR